MEETASPDQAKKERHDYLAEVFSAIILGLATVGAAYGAYQASLCDGNSLDKYSDALAKVSDANSKRVEALQNFTFDMITWMEWQSRIISADKSQGAQSQVDEEVADSILSDFMEDRMKSALIWSEVESEKRKKVVHPTESDEYALELFTETFEAEEAGKAALEEARRSGSLGDQYTLTTVLFTISMFFAGIASAFKHHRVRFTMVTVAALMLALTAAKLATLPMAG